MENDNSNDET
ncbi:unnamed protein product, partial [Rotaria sp. Silwood2]